MTQGGSPALTADEVNAYFHSDYPSAAASGIRCEDLGDGWAVARWAFDPAQLRPGGYISGPTQFTLADTAIWFAVFTVIGISPMAVTTDLSISFLRPATGADLLARADLDRVGRSRISARVLLWVDGAPGRPVSHAIGSYARPLDQ
jgi:uncharacterized protein (TIGR00369 family)